MAASSGRLSRRLLIEGALIGLLALTLNLAGNSRVSLWDRDEPRYAECTREMVRAGTWIFPTFNGEPRYHKPVLIYWLMRASTALAGDNTFGARLVSAIAGVGTVLLTFAFGVRAFGPTTGRLAALILATAPIMVIESKLATTDATLTLFLVGGQFALWSLARKDSPIAAAIFWLTMSLAFLTKGPVGPLLVAAAGVVSWWWGGPTASWSRLRWRWGIPAFLAITLPWFVAIGVASRGEFYRYAVGHQIIHRVTSGMEEHGAFPGYYAVFSILVFYPWSSLAPAALYASWRRRKANPDFGFLLGWVVGPWIVLECVRTKLIHYYLPAYPAAALLVAWLVGEIAADVRTFRRHRFGRLGNALLAGIGFGVTVFFVAAPLLLPGPMRWPCLVLAAILGGGTLYSLDRLHRARTLPGVHALCATWGLALWVAAVWLLPAAEPYRVSRIVGEKLRTWSAREVATPMLATFQQPSVIYTYGRPVERIEDAESLSALLRARGPVVAALMPQEVRMIGDDPRFRVTIRETIDGFNVDKGRDETLHLAVIRDKEGDGPAESSSAVAGRTAEELQVK